MRFGMAHSIMLLAARLVVVMFFVGLTGCASVVVISWISIFRDGFSDIRGTKTDSHWELGQSAFITAESNKISASQV